jgi:hypothetical protein
MTDSIPNIDSPGPTTFIEDTISASPAESKITAPGVLTIDLSRRADAEPLVAEVKKVMQELSAHATKHGGLTSGIIQYKTDHRKLERQKTPGNRGCAEGWLEETHPLPGVM